MPKKSRHPAGSLLSRKLGTIRRGSDTLLYKVVKSGSGSGKRWKRIRAGEHYKVGNQWYKLQLIAGKRKGKRVPKPYRKGRIMKKLNFKRGSPAASATLFRIGETRRGNDGRMYKIIRSGISRRWSLAT